MKWHQCQAWKVTKCISIRTGNHNQLQPSPKLEGPQLVQVQLVPISLVASKRPVLNGFTCWFCLLTKIHIKLIKRHPTIRCSWWWQVVNRINKNKSKKKKEKKLTPSSCISGENGGCCAHWCHVVHPLLPICHPHCLPTVHWSPPACLSSPLFICIGVGVCWC